METKNELVIIDLDDTLLNGQSQEELLFYLRKSGLVSFWRFAFFSLWILCYKFGLVHDPEKIMRRAYQLLAEKKVSDIEKRMEDFFSGHLKRLLYADGRVLIARHQREGRTILLLSNSPDFLVKRAAAYLSVPYFIATRLEVKNERFTGKIEKEIMYGENKLKESEAFARGHGFNLKEAWAYGDHFSDLFLMERVGHPVAVNPGKALKRIAEERLWPVLTFA